MFDMNYEEIYVQVKEKLADPNVSVDMKRALLDFEIGVRRIECQELKESIEKNIDKIKTSPEDEDVSDEDISHGC